MLAYLVSTTKKNQICSYYSQSHWPFLQTDGLKEAHIHCDLEDNFKMPLDPREPYKIYFLKGIIT